MELVSVILPTYNRANLVTDAVQSVIRQTYPNFDLIIIDDGSTDNTREILAPFLADSRVRYIQKENGGAASARNLGLELAKGSFIAFIDSDDIWADDKLEVQMEIFDRLPNISLVFSDFSSTNRTGEFEFSHIKTYFGVFNDYHLKYEDVFFNVMNTGTTSNKTAYKVYYGNVYQTMLFGNMILTSTWVSRRQVFESAGNFDLQYSTLEDYDLLLKITKLFAVAFIDHPLVTYRYNPNQLSGEYHFEKLCHNLDNIFEKNLQGIDISFRKDFKQRIAQHRGMIQEQMGYYYFSHNQSSEALHHYWKSLTTYPLRLRPLVYLVLCWLPKPIISVLRRVKRQFA